MRRLSGRPRSCGAEGPVANTPALELQVTTATLANDADFAAFSCWDGDDATPWIEEAENYVRGFVLRRAENVLAFRTAENELVAVSAFDERTIHVPIVNPVAHDGWHLQVVAIDCDHQKRQLSRQIFEATFAAMRDRDPSRVYVTARVHKDHSNSAKACDAVGLSLLRPNDEHYLILLGEVPAQ